jgi:hypothetical protein
VLLKLEIPGTYDTSTTTGKQWLRFGLEGQAGAERMVLGDRVMLSTSNGGWARSTRDLNKILNQNPSSLPVDTTQGNTGVGTCFTHATPVIVCDKDGQNFRTIPMSELDKGMYVFSGATRVNLVVDIKDGVSQVIILCKLSNGVEWECSPSERFITSRADRKGTRIDDLTLGDSILCWENGRVGSATIEEYAILYRETPVRTPMLKGGRTYVAGHKEGERFWGAIAHNLKPLFES